MPKIVIAGGTGFLGQSLANYLQKHEYEVVIIARHEIRDLPYKFCQWDGENVGEWAKELENAEAIVNLAGRTVDCIKTPDHCDEILRSRVESTRAIGRALKQTNNPPKIWIQMATAHIYGDPPRAICTEESATGYGLAPTVGKVWEETFKESLPESTRGVIMRTSFVIGKNGGALKSLSKIVKLGLGGKVGSGNQGMSWLHELDFNRFVHQSLEENKFEGIYILSSPKPVSNKEFMKKLRRTLRMPLALPTPEWIARLGANLVFKTDPELAIYGRYVVPKRLMDEGFQFEFPELQDALNDLLKTP